MLYEREKKVDCGEYREVDIIPRTEEADKAVKGKRGKRKKISTPKQRNLNDKNAKRFLLWLLNGNFSTDDIHLTATYSDEYLPETREDADKIAANYLNRVAYLRKKKGLPPLKYVLITESGLSKEGDRIIRVHHHIVMNGGLSREELELMWTKKRINWKKIESDPEYKKEIEESRMGYRNADRLQPNENGLEALCEYVAKNPRGKKRWSCSQNLNRPVELPPADKKYTKAQVERLAKSTDCGKEFFEKKFPNYNIVSVKPVYYEETGWHIYMRMWKKKKATQRKKTARKRE